MHEVNRPVCLPCHCNKYILSTIFYTSDRCVSLCWSSPMRRIYHIVYIVLLSSVGSLNCIMYLGWSRTYFQIVIFDWHHVEIQMLLFTDFNVTVSNDYVLTSGDWHHVEIQMLLFTDFNVTVSNDYVLTSGGQQIHQHQQNGQSYFTSNGPLWNLIYRNSKGILCYRFLTTF